MSALTSELKSEIQTAYRTWLEAHSFKPRRGQREMIARIAQTCTAERPPRTLAIEAGTGTGKTAAYFLAAIPIAKALDKTLVIASATVALQEQIVLRDLPDLKRNTGLDFSFALAKGRGRYLCPKRLDQALQPEAQKDLALFYAAAAAGQGVTYQRMLDAFAKGGWNGERDSWNEELEPSVWSGVTTDHRGCANKKCSFYTGCPFFKARAKLRDADVIVANQDLLLVDYALGGGAVLPSPEASIVIVDEAHHLPDKTQDHFAAKVRLRGAINWADQVNAALGTLTQKLGRPQALERLAKDLAVEYEAFKLGMEGLHGTLAQLPFAEKDADTDICRFGFGRIEGPAARAAAAAAAPLKKIGGGLSATREFLRNALDGECSLEDRLVAEDWLPAVGQLEARAEATETLLVDYAQADGEVAAGAHRARWVQRTEQDLEAVSAPIEPGPLLGEWLWSRCYAGVATSATLAALGRFDRYFERSGLQQTQGVRISSPFDYPRVAVLAVPNMNSSPKDFAAHTAETALMLPELLAKERTALVLCTSWRQLRGLADALAETGLADAIQVQGRRSKQAMLKAHHERVDAGKPSYVFGLASFAEGVDLPGDYCRHVIVVKLPFAVPDDPVDAAIAELAEAQGRNAFMEISVPDASMKLVQACGRLIRNEHDHGRITLLDKRVLTHRYGRTLLDSLPPFRRELGRILHQGPR